METITRTVQGNDGNGKSGGPDLSLSRFREMVQNDSEDDSGGGSRSGDFKKLKNYVSYKTIVLARAQSKFIAAEVTSAVSTNGGGVDDGQGNSSTVAVTSSNPTARAFLRDWETVDGKLAAEFQRLHSQQHGRRVPVCACCAAAYTQLEYIRRHGFGVPGTVRRPASEHMVSRTGNTTSRGSLSSRQRSQSSRQQKRSSRQRGGLGSRSGANRSPSRGRMISSDPIDEELAAADRRMLQLEEGTVDGVRD